MILFHCNWPLNCISSWQVKGQIITGATPSEMVSFIDLPTTLWSRSMGDPRKPGGDGKWSERLRGRYVWPFSISMPPTVSVPQIGGQNEVFRLPQTFFERHTRAQIQYEVVVRFTRTKLRSDHRYSSEFLFPSYSEYSLLPGHRLSTTLNYIPLTRPSSPSRLRQLAYQQNTALLGPDSDPEGWHTFPVVRTRGKLASSSRSVDAKCTVRFALIL